MKLAYVERGLQITEYVCVGTVVDALLGRFGA